MSGIRLGNEEQKRLILDCLHDVPMTVEMLAGRLLCSPDTVRKRLKELQEETRMVRVVGWDMKGTALVRLWGVGAKKRRTAAVPPPRELKRALREKRVVPAAEKAVRKEREESVVPYRLEALDKWLFAIRRVS